MRTPKSKEHVEKMRLREHTTATKDKMSQSKLGVKFSKEHKEKLSLAKLGRKRKPFTDETKEKMRLAKLGKKRNKKKMEDSKNV